MSRRLISQALEAEILRTLPARLESWSGDALRDELLHRLRAGERLVTEERAIVRQAARRVDAARRALRCARRHLAAVTQPGDQPPLRAPAWARREPILRANLSTLMARPGVLGATLGYRVRGGVQIAERVVTVFVRDKRPVEALEGGRRDAVPRRLTAAGRGIGTDVVELGEFEETAAGGDSLGPAGRATDATIACFAEDVRTNIPVALTAMHLITKAGLAGSDDLAFVSPCDGAGGGPALGRFLRGTERGVDAAAIALDGAAPPNAIRGIGDVRGWRPLVDPADRGVAVRMYGAASSSGSGEPVVGRIDTPSVALPALDLDDAILVDIRVRAGDSGAAIVDNDEFVLGLLKGRFTGGAKLAVFTPIGAALAKLDCWIP